MIITSSLYQVVMLTMRRVNAHIPQHAHDVKFLRLGLFCVLALKSIQNQRAIRYNVPVSLRVVITIHL
jgi:hypothetical protein